jgi:tyrosine-specific transport protein
MAGPKRGSILGGILLIGGSCLGAGMLALPILTGLAGFFPALVMFGCAWVFMTLTALLMVEVNVWFPNRVNLITMAGHSLGQFGRALTWILYLFLFYALLVAYISGSGNLSSTFFHVPAWLGSLFFVVLFGTVVYCGMRTVDLWNRVLMFCKIAAYVGMVCLGVKYIEPELLLRMEPSYMLAALPILVISFGYHNMIPTLVSYFNRDIKRVRITILGGSLFIFLVYLIWEILVLGIVPQAELLKSLGLDREASQAIADILGSAWVSTFAQALAFFAILTSFLTQSTALVHFLSDGLKVKQEKNPKQREKVGMCALTLLPPLALALIYPQLFFKALNFAGGVCTVILFGILPAAMVWTGRYVKKVGGNYQVMGGKPLLIGITLFSLFILIFQISSMFGFSL